MSSFTNSPITMSRNGDSKVIKSTDRPTKPGPGGAEIPVVWILNSVTINSLNVQLGIPGHCQR
jgi:hypothetical protein